MATKRVPFRRYNLLGEAVAWGETFSSGYDFFSALEEFGICELLMPRAEFVALARDAWARLKDQFDRDNAEWAFTEFENGN